MEKTTKGQSIPRWAQEFQCYVVKDGTTPDRIEYLSGRLQAQSANTVNMNLSDTLQYFLKVLNKERASGVTEDKINRTALLVKTYAKTGKNLKDDGTPVCYSFPPCLLLTCMVVVLCLPC